MIILAVALLGADIGSPVPLEVRVSTLEADVASLKKAVFNPDNRPLPFPVNAAVPAPSCPCTTNHGPSCTCTAADCKCRATAASPSTFTFAGKRYPANGSAVMWWVPPMSSTATSKIVTGTDGKTYAQVCDNGVCRYYPTDPPNLNSTPPDLPGYPNAPGLESAPLGTVVQQVTAPVVQQQPVMYQQPTYYSPPMMFSPPMRGGFFRGGACFGGNCGGGS